MSQIRACAPQRCRGILREIQALEFQIEKLRLIKIIFRKFQVALLITINLN